MILFQAYLADQAMFNCCWLYAPAIAKCLVPDPGNFNMEVDFFKSKILFNGFTQNQFDTMFQEGAPADFTSVRQAMGLKIVGNLQTIAEKASGDQNELYWGLSDILETYGPVVLQHAALGSGSIHHSAFVGLIMGKVDAKETANLTYVITAHTQLQRYTAIPVDILLEHSRNAQPPVTTDIFQVPDRYSTQFRIDGLVKVYDVYASQYEFYQEVTPLARSI